MTLSSSRAKLLSVTVIILLLISNVITICFYLNDKYAVNEEDYFERCQEEIDDFKLFVCDWYTEISARGEKADIYKNEIRFRGGQYPLTVSANRIRAVFPRGERFFRLHYIEYAEFYEENNRVICRIFYGNGGEFAFKVN